MLTEQRSKTKLLRRKPRPFCPRHEVEMIVGRTGKLVRYWYCPITVCKCSSQEYRQDAEIKVEEESSVSPVVNRPERDGPDPDVLPVFTC